MAHGSHYETLRVSRDAPPEVIRAAYKALASKHHPDKTADPQANRVMSELNFAYEALSDPIKRAEYDALLDASHDRRSNESGTERTAASKDSASGPADSPPSRHNPTTQGPIWPWALAAVCAIFVLPIARQWLIEAPSSTGSSAARLPGSFNPIALPQPTREQAIAEQVKQQPPTPHSIPSGQLAIVDALSPSPGQIRLKLVARSNSSERPLEGSLSRALRWSQPWLCGPRGVLSALKLESTAVVLSVYENEHPVGEVPLPSTFCSGRTARTS